MDDTVKELIAAIEEMYPGATRFAVVSSDQATYGFHLTNVGFGDTTIDCDSDTFAEFADTMWSEYLGDLAWGVFHDRNADTDFDVSTSTGFIIR